MAQDNQLIKTEHTDVLCTESIFRSVGKDCFNHDSNGNLRFSSTAFNDPSEKPSVNRACINSDPELVKRHTTHGVVTLIVGDVRSIEVPINHKDPSINYSVDVKHRPEVDNPSHAQIESAPAPTGSRFKRIKEKLAQLADSAGWTCKPS